jgi:hypothetical protein
MRTGSESEAAPPLPPRLFMALSFLYGERQRIESEFHRLDFRTWLLNVGLQAQADVGTSDVSVVVTDQATMDTGLLASLAPVLRCPSSSARSFCV